MLESNLTSFFSVCPARWCTAKRFQFQLSATVRQYIIRGWPSAHAVHTPPGAILCTKLFTCLFGTLHTDWCVIRPTRQWPWLQHVASNYYLDSHLCFGCGCDARVQLLAAGYLATKFLLMLRDSQGAPSSRWLPSYKVSVDVVWLTLTILLSKLVSAYARN